MTHPQRITSRVMAHRQISSSGYELELERGELSFEAGQLLTIHGPDITMDRSYSIASGTGDDHLRVLYRLIPNGRLTNVLLRLKEGDPLDISAPYGGFTLRDPSRPLLFVATGTGIAPARSYIRTRPGLDLSIVHGVRYEEDLFYRDEMEGYGYVPCLSRQQGSEYAQRVTDHVREMPLTPGMHFYLCGAYEMIFDVNEILCERGVSDADIFTEEYYYTFNG